MGIGNLLLRRNRSVALALGSEGGKSGQHRALHLEKLRVLVEESAASESATENIRLSLSFDGKGENVR